MITMIIQIKKHKDGNIELLEQGKSLALLTKEQAKTLSQALEAATR